MVEFCQKCESILIGNIGDEIKCNSCGYKNILKSQINMKKNIIEKKTIKIVDEKNLNINPKTKVDCIECGCDEAFYFTKQTRAADEPETQFFECCKCSHKWRDYR